MLCDDMGSDMMLRCMCHTRELRRVAYHVYMFTEVFFGVLSEVFTQWSTAHLRSFTVKTSR